MRSPSIGSPFAFGAFARSGLGEGWLEGLTSLSRLVVLSPAALHRVTRSFLFANLSFVDSIAITSSTQVCSYAIFRESEQNVIQGVP